MTELTTFHPEQPEGVSPDQQYTEVLPGQWYWVDKGTEKEWFGCVVHVGSNYLRLDGQNDKWASSTSTDRIHFNDFWTRLIFEPNHTEVLATYVKKHHTRSSELMQEVRVLTSKLGLAATTARIGGPAEPDTGTAIAVISGQGDIEAYKTALALAKDKTLPELFEQIKKSNEIMAAWMKAEAISMEALMNPMKASLKEIDGRLFNIRLYAGLTEDAEQIVEGEPAPVGTKLHVMQRRLHMDEECLMCYEGGGMEFKDIHAFDEWLARPDNMYRLLPFERTLVGFRVRRYTKERDSNGRLLQAFINMEIAKSDVYTFFYVRNGEQLWRISCDLDFGESIFPDRDQFDPSEGKMEVRGTFASETKIVSKRLYDKLCEEYLEVKAQADAWDAAYDPAEDDKAGTVFRKRNPYKSESYNNSYKLPSWNNFDPSKWVPMDQSNVRFDDYMGTIKDQFDKFNRIAIIIQGLFDRSMVLHPHYPVSIWKPESFEAAIELVYDNSAALYAGDKPDFLAYQKACNDQIKDDSVLTGQEDFWMELEANRANEAARRNPRYRDRVTEYVRYSPYGNPGPGFINTPDKWAPRAKKATFRWMRERIVYDRWNQGGIETTVTVPVDRLFNVSAYKPGDFKKFYSDPRTRREYIQWAPYLLAAEDYHAGKISKGAGRTVFNRD